MTDDRGACDGPWHRRHRLALDVMIVAAFVLLDTGLTMAGATWWPAHPGTLAWVMLGVQALACASLAVRRTAPLTVVGVLGAFTLAVTLLIAPAGVLTPAHEGQLWAPPPPCRPPTARSSTNGAAGLRTWCSPRSLSSSCSPGSCPSRT
ncbi:hypothetical protein [Streptomyces sp. NPDC001410]|uniref:hypothetical protein n=1 Tax=Streptomyces sp. NPDC001410 TaxID=3364574 RepID=UPI0036B0E7D8